MAAAKKKPVRKSTASRKVAKADVTPVKRSSRKTFTPFQERLIEEYMIDLNATQAAIRAGCQGKNPQVTGYKTLQLPHVQAALTEKIKARSKRVGLQADRVLEELRRIVTFDPRTLYNEDGTLKKVHELDDSAAAVISAVEVEEITVGKGKEARVIGYTKRLKFWDKVSALDKAMRHLGLLRENSLNAFFELHISKSDSEVA